MKPLIYRPEAADDVEAAFQWYEGQRTGLGDEFLAALGGAERRIRETPGAFRAVWRDTCRIQMRRFPYQLFYRVLGETVVVVGCFHARRSPRRARGRR